MVLLALSPFAFDDVFAIFPDMSTVTVVVAVLVVVVVAAIKIAIVVSVMLHCRSKFVSKDSIVKSNNALDFTSSLTAYFDFGWALWDNSQ